MALQREDGKKRQHFNLTQVPFDVEVDEHGFSFDYLIAIAYEIGTYKWSKHATMEKVKARLEKMKVEFGDMIGEPIAIMCYHKSSNWSGVIKIHLKNPIKDERGFSMDLDLSSSYWMKIWLGKGKYANHTML